MNVVIALFGVFFTGYFLHALYTNLVYAEQDATIKPGSNVFLIQTPLFILSIIIAAREGYMDRGLISPPYIALGMFAGHLTFAVSVWITHRNGQDAWKHFVHIRPILHFFQESPTLIIRFLVISVLEEIIYRAALQPLLINWSGSPLFAIVVVAILFSVVHWHFFRNRLLDSLEFLGFSIFLGVVFYYTGNLALVIIIHTLRNLEIVYLEYLVKLEELNDESSALQFIEQQYVRQTSEKFSR